MTKEELKKAVCEAIEKRFDDIKAFGESIFANRNWAIRNIRRRPR